MIKINVSNQKKCNVRMCRFVFDLESDRPKEK